ncbi:MAG: tetratricopeptide repeat protein [Saprospiraceae bacterium]
MENNIERIDRYLSGQMDQEEKKAFDAEIAANPLLEEELALQKDMANFLKRKDQRDVLKQQLHDISNDYFKTTEQDQAKIVQLPRRRLSWMIAASAAAVIIFILVWQFLLSPSLFEQYAQYPPLALAEKSAATTIDWSQTETAFNSGNYEAAEIQLTEYLNTYPNDQLAKLYLGICKMELNKLEAAQQIFQSFSAADVSIKDYADWYFALSYLKAGDQDKSRAILQKITIDSPLYQKAQELLEKI